MSPEPECVSVGETLKAAALEGLTAAMRVFDGEHQANGGAVCRETRTRLKQSVVLAASYGALSSAEAAKMIESLRLKGD